MTVCVTVFAACAVVSTSMAQILTSTNQKSLNLDALQLLHHTAPIIALVNNVEMILTQYSLYSTPYFHI